MKDWHDKPDPPKNTQNRTARTGRTGRIMQMARRFAFRAEIALLTILIACTTGYAAIRTLIRLARHIGSLL